MIPLADTIVGELATPDGRNLQDKFLQAMFMIERYRGIDAGWKDIVKEVADSDVSDAAIARLATALRKFIPTHKDHPDVGSAIWALGKLRAPEDMPLYDRILAPESGYSSVARDQATCAREETQS
jgi:hypothetical protein